MKLIIKQYLACLKERDELDALLPDLLSQMGLTVFSRPGRGTRQDGVDVGAVGSIDGNPEKVYLFSIKAGDLTRTAWDGDTVQSLRPSLNEILDTYIPNRLPLQHQGKDLVICLCFGGDIQEQVRPQVEGYIRQNSKSQVSFEEWNGDRLAQLILSHFLREEILPENSRPHLRKALALLDEADASYRHFSTLVRALENAGAGSEAQRLISLRQLCICLWILFAWSRDAGNVEAAYLSSELTVLHAWELGKGAFGKRTKKAKLIQQAFASILHVYQVICNHYLGKILPHTNKLDALSAAVRGSCSIDVNIKLFDVLSRVAMSGIWSIWRSHTFKNNAGAVTSCKQQADVVSQALKNLISNNPTLFLPVKDDHAIDISLAILLLAVHDENKEDIKIWLREIADRSIQAYECHGPYPCTLRNYTELLDHPKHGDLEYREEVTEGSILYPVIALWGAILKDDHLVEKMADAKTRLFGHCNFQYWFPDEITETFLYTNKDMHGAVLSHLRVDLSPKENLENMWKECEQTQNFGNLTARLYGFWPLILVACRHYRLPVPWHFTLGFREEEG